MTSSSISPSTFPKVIFMYLLVSSFLFLCPMIYSATQNPIDTIDITGFSKCSLTTRWFQLQFSPFLSKFPLIPKGLSINYHPLSIGSKMENGSKIATCQNGWLECELNKLQCCSKKHIKAKNSALLLNTLACIQGKESLEKGTECLPGEGNVAKLILNCSKSGEGEKLLLDEPYPHNDSISLPWIVINGVRSFDATRIFQKIVCGLESAKNEKPCLE